MTVHFGAKDRSVWLKTVIFWTKHFHYYCTTVHLRFVEVPSSDRSLWIKLGKVALIKSNYSLSQAFIVNYTILENIRSWLKIYGLFAKNIRSFDEKYKVCENIRPPNFENIRWWLYIFNERSYIFRSGQDRIFSGKTVYFQGSYILLFRTVYFTI